MDKKYNSTNNIFSNNNSLDNESNILDNYNEFINKYLISQISSLEERINKEKSFKNRIKPKDLISDALKIGEKLKSPEYLDNKNKMNKLEIIDDARNNARTMYIDNSIENSKNRVIEELKNYIKSSNLNAINSLKDNLKQIINNKKAYSKMIKENEKLELQLSECNKDVNLLNQKLFKKNDEINKLQIKFEPFKKIIPFFEELNYLILIKRL